MVKQNILFFVLILQLCIATRIHISLQKNAYAEVSNEDAAIQTQLSKNTNSPFSI
jgi:hypothetical protein